MAQRLREKLQRAMATPPDSQSEQSQASSHDFGGPKASQFEPGVKCARLALSSPDAAPAARWHMHQKSDWSAQWRKCDAGPHTAGFVPRYEASRLRLDKTPRLHQEGKALVSHIAFDQGTLAPVTTLNLGPSSALLYLQHAPETRKHLLEQPSQPLLTIF